MPTFRAFSRAIIVSLAGIALAATQGCAHSSSTTVTPHAGHGYPRGETVAASNKSGPTIEQFMKIRAPGSPTLAPNGTLYVRDWPDGVNQLYARKAGTDLKAPMTRLTDFKDGLAAYSLSPDATKIALSAAVGGNEQYQLWILDTATNKITPALQDPKVVYRFNLWLRDSSGFVYAANDVNQSDFHLYRYDFSTDKSEKLLSEKGDWHAADITDDASRLLVINEVSISDSRVFELQASTHELKDISVGKAPSANPEAAYMPGEKEALIVSDMEEGLLRLFVKDIASGSVKKPLPALDRNDVDGIDLNPARNLLAVIVNKDGYGEMQMFDLPDFKAEHLPPIEKGLVGSVNMRGKTVTWTLSNTRTPGVAFAYNLGDSSVRQITAAETQGVDLAAFPLPTLVKYKSFDGLEIPAFLFTPPGYKAGTRIPFIVNFHGGPEGQHRPGFGAQMQYMLSRGYGVMMPNVRGSTGYGRAYHEMDNYKKRWDSVKDGVAAAHWLVDSGYARAGKIAAFGGSYGGFMAVATIVEDGASSDPVFGASIDIVGIVNMKTFLEQTRDYRRKLREAEYGPLTDPEFLATISSINRIDDIKVPMMIAHGLNDPRVPVGEAMQLAVGLQKRGYDPELLFFPDEGHGFVKLENRLLFAERAAAFLDKNIGPESMR